MEPSKINNDTQNDAMFEAGNIYILKSCKLSFLIKKGNEDISLGIFGDSSAEKHGAYSFKLPGFGSNFLGVLRGSGYLVTGYM